MNSFYCVNYNVIALTLRMHTAKGCIEEIYLDGSSAARLSCPPALIPAPGQYVLASTDMDPHATIAQPLFSAGACPNGFFAAPPFPAHWLPGAILNLRGPLGHGFTLPATARKVVLAAYHVPAARVLALLAPALTNKASILLLSDQPPANLPSALEILPLSALAESLPWADYLALDTTRAHLDELLPQLLPDHPRGYANSTPLPVRGGSAQILLGTPMPCAGMADCGVCALSLPHLKGYRLACKDGPVFDLY